MNFSIIAACDLKNGIGLKNKIPWHLSGDLKHFVKLTSEAPEGKQNAVIMGRKTWESLPEQYKPLPKRLNVVLTRSANLELPDSVEQFKSLDDALTVLNDREDISQTFVLGGGQIYKEAVIHPDCKKLYITRVSGDFACDTFFPDFEDKFQLTKESDIMNERGVEYKFEEYEK